MTLGKDEVRIIPAYAGSTISTSTRGTPTRDHPRIRGEHAGLDAGKYAGLGSSPHTRGARRVVLGARDDRRIIPAYAGSTEQVERIQEMGLGSSPHTRGARVGQGGGAEDDRIIPAYAGSTRLGPPGRRAGSGSSPHTRGAPRGDGQSLAEGRIIPAYAGSTSGGMREAPTG